MNISRGKIVLVLVLMSISISILLYSFAYTTVTQPGTFVNYLTVSDISFGLVDSVESINLGEQVPTIDKFGLLNDAFSFSVVNTDTKQTAYTILLVDRTASTIANTEIRYQLIRNGVEGEIKDLSLDGKLDSGMLAAGDSIDYSIKVWLKYDAETVSGTWDKIVSVIARTENFDYSGANEPVLVENMIPVYYDTSDSLWKKADITNSNDDYLWHDYDAGRWANVVTVNSTNRANYVDNTISPPGTTILMGDITAFYVWIPRFEYKDFPSGAQTMVEVSFLEGTTTTSLVHPAFSFDGEELTGFWVSKFELSPLSGSTCYTNVNSTNCSKSPLHLTSKPNQKSLHYTTISNLFKNIRNMELSGNIHGFVNSGTTLNTDGTITGDNNNFDIHLIKSFENGALTYLTYSQYGKYGNSAYDENNKYIFSNNSNTKTGSSYVGSTTYAYDIDYYGTGASTTGTVYGVYDLNGTVQEFVMLNVLTSAGAFYAYSSSGFSTIHARYYDGYPYTSSSSGITGVRGDAIDEFAGFEGTSTKPYYSYPYLLRVKGTTFNRTRGAATINVGGRAVITVEDDVYITLQ